MNDHLESILLRVSQSECIDDGDLEKAARLILECVVDGLGVKRTGIWLLDEDGESMICRLLIDVHNHSEVENIVLTRKEYPQYFNALDSERAIRINDAFTDPVTAEFIDSYLTPLGIGCMLDTPIRHRGRMIGIICSEGTIRGHQWSDDEATFSGVLSDLYGRAMSSYQRAKLEEALRIANTELEQKVAERTQALHDTLQELKDTQAHLIESEKMAALGGLVSGVAHEVNTPLGVAITAMSYIKDEVEQLRGDYQKGCLDEQGFTHFLSEFDSAYGISRSNLERAAKLVSDFKKTAVGQSSNVIESICLKATIDALLTSLHPMYKQLHVQIHLAIPAQLAMVTYSGAIDQILTNLISNSCIHGFQGAEQDNHIYLRVEQVDGHVLIDYRDNGLGMSADVCRRVFEPFYTTNRSDGGSGLGMSITYNLVTQKLKGEICVVGDSDQGAHFQIRLPLTLES